MAVPPPINAMGLCPLLHVGHDHHLQEMSHMKTVGSGIKSDINVIFSFLEALLFFFMGKLRNISPFFQSFNTLDI